MLRRARASADAMAGACPTSRAKSRRSPDGRDRDRRRRRDGPGDRLQPGERSRGSGGKRIVVVDGHYLAWGASGRNGGGVRQQWSTEMNIRLMQESMEICARFAKGMRINVWMRQGGYLFLARDAGGGAPTGTQRRAAEPLRRGDADDRARGGARAGPRARRASRFVARLLQPDRRHRLPVAVPVGLRARGGEARRRDPHRRRRSRRSSAAGGGGGFRDHDAGGDASPPSGSSAPPAPGRRRSRGWSARRCPTGPQRHEILSTEPLKPFLKPMVTVLETGLYLSQSLRGEMVGGITLPDDRRPTAARCASARGWRSRPHGARAGRADAAPRRRQGRAPVGRPLRRQPDGNPIVGELPGRARLPRRAAASSATAS